MSSFEDQGPGFVPDARPVDPFMPAQNVEVRTPWKKKLKAWVDRQGVGGIIMVLFMLGLLLGFTMYEALNSARGWTMIADTAAPVWAAWCFGFVATIGYIGFHRRAGEKARAKKAAEKDALADPYAEKPDDMPGYEKEIVIMIGCALIALLGVFSNLADKTGTQQMLANESNADRAALRAELTVLERATAEEKFVQQNTMIAILRDTVESLEGEAIGWGMESIPVLSDAGAPLFTVNDAGQTVAKTTAATPEQCQADLRTRQRQICNDLNGSGGEFGLRGDLRIEESALVALEAKKARADEIVIELEGMSLESGSQHWDAIAKLLHDQVESSTVRIWLTFLASVIVLMVLGFAWDSFFEGREREIRKATRGKWTQ